MAIPTIQSKIIEKQREYLLEQARNRLGAAATQEDVSALADEYFYLYQNGLGKPLFRARQVSLGELPFIEDYYSNNQEMDRDLEILFSELSIIATYLVDYFNYSYSEKERILASVRQVNGTIGKLQMLAKESGANVIHFKESFNNLNGMDKTMNETENQSMIHTEEGILTLRRAGAANFSPDGRVRQVQGNGMAGTHHVVRKVQSDTEFENFEYVSQQTPNNIEEFVVDGNPDTIFEYQMVGVPEDFKREVQHYDVSWATAQQHGDLLRVRVVIQLDKSRVINWLKLNPYYSVNSPGTMRVHSIRTSADGFNYVGLFESDNFVLNQDINLTAQSFRLEDVFDGSEDFNNSKFAGQGVWSFPSREARFVEVVLEQPNSYSELLGQDCFYRRKLGATMWSRIPRQEVPANIADARYGVHRVGQTHEIKKQLETTMGWRYAVGIRDIQVMGFQFVETSEFISQQYAVENGISKLMLFSNEKIPSLYREIVAESNDWIQYYISFDDIDWIRVSPQHHNPVNGDFPPKLVTVNTNQADLEENSFLNVNRLLMNENPTKVRVRIVMRRPTETLNGVSLHDTTPIVEDFALRILSVQEEV